MPEEALQAAFEIKTACDEISRRLLRWHWEHKPGAHSLGALLDHVAQRQQESPDYYDRMPDLSGKNSWQQLDTTICMRVLLDPEKDAAKPLDLLGNTSNPGAARRACNAVRTARNEAAHATDHTDAAQAAILFNEAVESLEDGYVGTAFRENELARYYRDAENYLARCGAKEPIASSRAPEEKTAAHEPARQSTKQGQNRSTQSRKTAGSRSSGSRSTTARSSSAKSRSTAGRKRGGIICRPWNRGPAGVGGRYPLIRGRLESATWPPGWMARLLALACFGAGVAAGNCCPVAGPWYVLCFGGILSQNSFLEYFPGKCGPNQS